MPPLPGLGGSAILPQAQAPATLPQLFLPTGITSERVTFPEGHCHAGGGQLPASVPGVPVRLRNGCFPPVLVVAAAGEEAFGGAACGLIEKKD